MTRVSFVNPKQFILARKLLNLRQADLASEIGLTPTNYGNIENGKTDPKWSNLERIITFFKERGIIFYEDGNVILKKDAEVK